MQLHMRKQIHCLLLNVCSGDKNAVKTNLLQLASLDDTPKKVSRTTYANVLLQ